MYKKILYPTDFSDCSAKALKHIMKLTEAGTEEVVVLHVLDVRKVETAVSGLVSIGETERRYQDKLLKQMESDAEKKLDEVKDKLENRGMKVDIKIVTGIPFKEILELEKKMGISLIVLGSHGKSNIREMFLGSVSEKVIRKSKKPVLVLKNC